MPAEGVTDMRISDVPGDTVSGDTVSGDTGAYNRRKVYAEGTTPEVRVPFVEVSLSPTPGTESPNAPVLLYDTSGPGSDPRTGLAPLRLGWISGRADVMEHEGRAPNLRDDGRAAVRRAGAPEAFPGTRRRPLVGRGP